jgi:tRNA U38,U39,U40 pseudouridine synthase TruA
MRAGAELFLGRHDFASFRATGTLVRSTWREVFSFTLKEAKDTDDVQAWQRLGGLVF